MDIIRLPNSYDRALLEQFGLQGVEKENDNICEVPETFILEVDS